MFRRKPAELKLHTKLPDAKEVQISIIFTRLGEIDTINERFSCEATLFISWCESINMLVKCYAENHDDDTYFWDPNNFWDPQLYIESKYL